MENRKNIFLFSIKNRKNRKKQIFAEKRGKQEQNSHIPLILGELSASNVAHPPKVWEKAV